MYLAGRSPRILAGFRSCSGLRCSRWLHFDLFHDAEGGAFDGALQPQQIYGPEGVIERFRRCRPFAVSARNSGGRSCCDTILMRTRTLAAHGPARRRAPLGSVQQAILVALGPAALPTTVISERSALPRSAVWRGLYSLERRGDVRVIGCLSSGGLGGRPALLWRRSADGGGPFVAPWRPRPRSRRRVVTKTVPFRHGS
jgi:hypothetical protein